MSSGTLDVIYFTVDSQSIIFTEFRLIDEVWNFEPREQKFNKSCFIKIIDEKCMINIFQYLRNIREDNTDSRQVFNSMISSKKRWIVD